MIRASGSAYTRDTTNDGSTPPDYDTGSSLVDHGDGTYTFTFNTDVAMVTGVTYEPTLSHRVAGQIGSRRFRWNPRTCSWTSCRRAAT